MHATVENPTPTYESPASPSANPNAYIGGDQQQVLFRTVSSSRRYNLVAQTAEACDGVNSYVVAPNGTVEVDGPKMDASLWGLTADDMWNLVWIALGDESVVPPMVGGPTAERSGILEGAPLAARGRVNLGQNFAAIAVDGVSFSHSFDQGLAARARTHHEKCNNLTFESDF